MSTTRIAVFCRILFLTADWTVFAVSQTIVSVQSGNWNDPAVWSGGAIPGASDSVVLSDGHTITVDVDASCAVLIISGGTQISELDLGPGRSFTVYGDVSVSNASTHVRKTINVFNGSLNITGRLTLIGGTSGNEWAQLIVGTGTATIGNELILTNTRARVKFDGNGTLHVRGNFPSGGVMNPGTGTVIYDGNAPQTVGRYTYYNLSVNNSSGAAAGGNITVNGILWLSAGKLSLGSYNLTIGSFGSIDGASSVNYVVCDGTGRLVRTAGPDSITTYPIGTSASYNPAGIRTGIGNETFSVGVMDSLSPSPENDSVFVQRTWNITEGIPGGNGNSTLQFQWNASDEGTSFELGSSISCRFDGVSWVPTGTITDITGSDPYVATIADIAEFGSFALSSSGGVSAIKEDALPGQLHLSQNYPNPFNPTTAIEYVLPSESHVRLTVYNLLGQAVITLIDGTQEGGHQKLEWRANGVASGVYFYRIEARATNGPVRFSDVKKMMVMK